ncbi:response regulator transcription factor [Gordonia phosphorivorans]|uniref:Response regulator transcription factor n=1 Tax=Gordonia phosphorivorans TaxID=1056982 RepID=A0ABV6H7A3_9ACTN
MDSTPGVSVPSDEPADRPRAGLHALVVEDEPDLAAIVGDYLRSAGFDVTVLHDGAQAVESAQRNPPDVVVLDLGLPGLDGVEVCRRLRTFSDAYIVMLTARAAEVDMLIGLSVGADDYVLKPFSPRVLIARIDAMLRRPRAGAAQPDAQARRVREIGAVIVDLDARQVWVGGTHVHLTRTEFDILAALIHRPGVVVTREHLMNTVWGSTWVGDTHVVDVHIGGLRRKLDDRGDDRLIETVRGVGYRIDDPAAPGSR